MAYESGQVEAGLGDQKDILARRGSELEVTFAFSYLKCMTHDKNISPFRIFFLMY